MKGIHYAECFLVFIYICSAKQFTLTIVELLISRFYFSSKKKSHGFIFVCEVYFDPGLHWFETSIIDFESCLFSHGLISSFLDCLL